MAVVNSTLFLLLAMSSQVLTLPTEPIIPVPALSYPPYHPAHNPPAEVASTRTAVTKRPIVDHAAHHPPGDVAPTKYLAHHTGGGLDFVEEVPCKGPIVGHAAHNPPGDVAHTEHPAHHTAAGLDIIKEVLTKLPIIDAAHHAPGDPATTELAPTPTTPAATPTSPEPSNQPSPTAATSSPSLPIPSLATDTAPPSAIDLAPDPMDKYMIGMPTFFCTYRFQLNGKRDHYYLRGRNWNITGEQLETAVNKVVYNTPEWGVSPKGGADKDGKYKPGKNTTQDTITFKYSDTYVKDETNPVKGVQEFAAEVSLSPKILSLHFP